jgi:hypothetical protein
MELFKVRQLVLLVSEAIKNSDKSREFQRVDIYESKGFYWYVELTCGSQIWPSYVTPKYVTCFLHWVRPIDFYADFRGSVNISPDRPIVDDAAVKWAAIDTLQESKRVIGALEPTFHQACKDIINLYP